MSVSNKPLSLQSKLLLFMSNEIEVKPTESNVKLSVNDIFTSDSYPYGRLKCTATFAIEFDEKRGFRTVFQTINPKNGRLNAPKKSTYSDLLVMKNTNGFIDHLHFTFNGEDKMNIVIKFISDNFELFTPKQIEYFYIKVMAMSKASMVGFVRWCNAKPEELIPFFDPTIKLAVAGLKAFNNGEIINNFALMTIDVEGLENCKDKAFSPFTTITHEPISLT